MSNSRKRTINYKPRMTDFEAYDLLPPKIQHALQASLVSYDAYYIYREVEKRGIRKVLVMLEKWNAVRSLAVFVPARGIKGTKGYRPAWPSTVVSCKVKPLRANWTPTYSATQEMHR